MIGVVLALALSAPAPPGVPAPAEGPAAADAQAPTEGEAAQPAGEGGVVVSDGPVAVRASIEPDPSNIGDLLTLQVVVAYPRGVAVNLPTDLGFAPLHLVDVRESEPEPTGQELRKTFTIELQHFVVGEATVPSFPVTYVDEDGQVHTLDVPPVRFTVQSLIANDNDPVRKGEDPPISIEYPNETAELVAWSAAATLLLALLAWWALRRWLRRDKVVPAPPPIPPHEVALSALEELGRGDLLPQERFSDYYLQLTEIAKGYVEGRFGVEALDRTTEEIRRELVRRPDVVAPLSADEVVELLLRCDLVKFARFAPPREDAEADLATVRDMVERSRPASTPGKREAEAAPPVGDEGGDAGPEREEASP